MKLAKIALFGTTGVGKTTFFRILKQLYSPVHIDEIKLATPLYNVQEYIYKLCSTQRAYEVQDGVLLNFLGQHMRAINPKVLENYFYERIKFLENSPAVVCTDARPPDYKFIKDAGFTTILIKADKKVSQQRRIVRGDLSLSNPEHSTETNAEGEKLKFDFEISNNGSLEEFEESITKLMGKIL